MNNSVFKNADWICPCDLSKLSPVDVLSKQKNGENIDLVQDFLNKHFLFRSHFVFNKNGESVRLRITADDYYKLRINGNVIGQGPAQGYHFNYYWNEYDIEKYLKNGDNEILVEVYYHGLPCRAYNSGDNRIGMVAEIYQGNECILFTDENWESAEYSAYQNNRVIGANVYFLEKFDNNATVKWDKCYAIKTDYHFSSEPFPTVCRYRKKPIREEVLDDGSIFYDFGEEITAMLEITADAYSGDSIRILCGEETVGTDVRYKLRCNCEYDEEFILSDGHNHHEQYDYKGFRYVKLIKNGNVSNISLNAIVRHYDFDDDFCVLETDNELLKSIFELCKRSVKYGSQEVYVDCPTREKGQYSGDLLVTGGAHMILSGDTLLFKKALDNIIQSNYYSDTLLAVAPGSHFQEIADYSLIFPLLALEYFKKSGDREYLLENFKVSNGIINAFRKYERHDGLICGVKDKWNLVDWPANLRDGYDFNLEPPGEEPHNVLNAFYIGCVLLTEKIAGILNVPYEKRSIELVESFHKEFYDSENKIYTDCKGTAHAALHSNVLPVFFGFAREEAITCIFNIIKEKELSCGVYMSYYVLKALCKMGRYEEALSLILSKGEHSWLNMISEDATTCFEAWGKDQKHNTSLCHPWASSPIIILAEDILPNMPWVGKLKNCSNSNNLNV